MLVDAVGYTVGATRPVRRALSPSELYRRRRLSKPDACQPSPLPWCGYPFLGAIIEAQQLSAGFVLFALTLADCIYTLVTVPLLTPGVSGHVVPPALAAVLIIIKLVVT